MHKPDRTYSIAAIVGAVLSPLTAALISLVACEYASLFTEPFVSNAWAQSESPAQPAAPPEQKEEQNIPQPPEGQAGQKPPETPPPGTSQPSSGQPPSEQKEPEQEAPIKPEEGQEETTIFDVVHGWTSKSLLTSATWVDSFFGNERYLAEANQSYIRFRYNMFLEHESPMLLRPDLQIRIVLPQLREKTHIEFAGTPRETSSLNVTQAPSQINQFENPGDKSFTAGVSQFLRDTERVNFVVRAGLQWHHGGPVAILGPRFRILFPLDHWNLRFVEEVILRNDTGYQAKTTVDIERPLSHILFFRFTNDWIQTDHVDGYVYDFIFNISQPLSSTKALEYEWVNICQTQPQNALTEVDLRVRYRQRILRDWLYFEVAPQYRFPRDRGFEPTPGILFRLEAMFGHY